MRKSGDHDDDPDQLHQSQPNAPVCQAMATLVSVRLRDLAVSYCTEHDRGDGDRYTNHE